MRPFDLVATLIVLVAVLSYLNLKALRLPPTAGLMALSLLLSAGIAAAGTIAPQVGSWTRSLLARVDLGEALLHGMLGFLLFAGALHVDIGRFRRHKLAVAALATLGVLISAATVGGLMWWISGLLGLGLRPIDCLVFGALISPTDPIAVIGLLKRLGAPEPLKVQIAGESLFNDGVGVVLFLGLLEHAGVVHGAEGQGMAWIFLREALGGAAFGLAIGGIVYLMMRSVDHYQVEILLSLALVAGGYAAADALHLSGPIAMVVAGLLVGNHGRTFAMSDTTNQRLDEFWELIDEFLNASLFVLIGLEVLVLDFSAKYLSAGALAVPAVLAARWLSVVVSARVVGVWRALDPGSVAVLTWGGLRGGISVALALSLPGSYGGSDPPVRDILLAVTYIVVAFSTLVQGLSIGPLARRWLGPSAHASLPKSEAAPPASPASPSE
ncbi:Na(+)/H(+) antiporter NhaP [Aquisphaera giovannonii]|uniref:Na(+)/H(+) antiporter NhaP n=1 Tax=Aquisphaera giovannonii TaxID=406548 RepID=A0A5B9VZN2_9BACT|nr:sodium:proton antiporter [Aquisphaera giovannonii]QEH33427.1 Na(+)/H(+) antiporter NhaP [Aquisphaera giovannonii]